MPRPSWQERCQLEMEREHRLIRQMMSEDGLCSVMNKTKWRELCIAMDALTPAPEYRTQDILPRPLQPSRWDSDWYHVGRFEPIEWIEIRPEASLGVEMIADIAQSIGTVFERLEDRVRVYGYTRAGKPSGDTKRDA